jgi:phage gpG-like protein
MPDSYVKFDTKQFDKLVSELSKKHYVDVGITGKSSGKIHEGDNIPIASIGAVHEFGSTKRNIPERSFIRVPLQTHAKEIEAKVRTGAEAKIAVGDIKGVFEDIGLTAQTVIQSAFDTSGDGAWPPLQPKTINRRRNDSDLPLLDTGELRKAVTHKVGTNS